MKDWTGNSKSKYVMLGASNHSDKEIVKPFLSKTIRVCDRCGKMDIKTYAKYELQNDKYVLVGAYSRCQSCEKTEDFSKEDLKLELGWK